MQPRLKSAMAPLSVLRMAWQGFGSPALEQAWRLDFNASQINLDITACIIAIVMAAVDAPKSLRLAQTAPRLQTAIIVVFYASNYLGNLSFLWLIRYRRAWYVRHRCALLASFKIFRTCLYGQLMWRAGQYFLARSPLELPPGRWKALMRSMLLPSIIGRFAIMWHLPVAETRLVSGAALAVATWDNFGRCAAELAAAPGQGERYLAAVDAAAAGSVRWGVPVVTFASRLPGADPAGLTGYGACVVAKSTAQIVIGYALPMCVVLAAEAASRSDFSLSTGVGFTLRPSLSAMIAQNALLLPLQACIVFTAAATAARWAGL